MSKKVKLSEIANIKMGQSPSGDTCNDIGNGIALLNGPAEFTSYYPVPKQYTIDGKRFSDKGDILFCVRGSTTGRMNWADQKYALGRGLASISHKNGKEYNHFLKFLLQSNLNGLLNAANGSTFPNLTSDILASFVLNVPEDKTQKSISFFLHSIDSKIELNNRINAELEAMAKTLYDYWFVQFDFPDKNGKPYKTSGGKMVWNDELNREIPDGWSNATLLNNSLTAIIKPGIDVFSGKKKYLATADINNNDVGLGNEITYTQRESRANMQPVKNSIWFAKMKNSRKHLFVGQKSNEIISKNILSTGFMGLSCNEIAFEYLAGYITSDVFEITKDIVSHGATMQGIGNDDLKFFKIVIPDTDNIINFKKSTSAIYEKMEVNRIENQKLTELRDWLLPMLMNGQVKVSEL
jgi:type I restriction enzyme S subunit